MDADRQIFFVGEPKIMEKYLGLGTGIVENKRGFMGFYLF